MKTVELECDYLFKVCSTVQIQYRSGIVYKRVPEAQAWAILAAGAGRLVDE